MSNENITGQQPWEHEEEGKSLQGIPNDKLTARQRIIKEAWYVRHYESGPRSQFEIDYAKTQITVGLELGLTQLEVQMAAEERKKAEADQATASQGSVIIPVYRVAQTPRWLTKENLIRTSAVFAGAVIGMALYSADPLIAQQTLDVADKIAKFIRPLFSGAPSPSK